MPGGEKTPVTPHLTVDLTTKRASTILLRINGKAGQLS